jgi:hypothetical protein
LIAIGAAPIILSLLPCTVMCALGLCMMSRAGRTMPPPSAEHVTETDMSDRNR